MVPVQFSPYSGLCGAEKPKWGLAIYRHKPITKQNDIKRWSFGLGYDYVVTKTLHWYADAGIMQQNQKTDDSSTHLRGSEFVVGMVKYF